MDNNLEIKTLPVCRTCTEEITNIPFFHLDFAQVNTEPTIGQKLSNCIPELDLSIVRNAIICSTCIDIINFVYNFKNNCLRSELEIHKYIQQLQHTGDVDLAEVTQLNQLHYRNLSTEFKSENIEGTENFKYQETLTLLSGDTTFNEADNDSESTTNKYLLSLQKVDRECVLFNTDDFLFSYSNPATEENSNTYDNSNILQDCITQMVDNPDGNIQDLGTTDIFYECYTCGHKISSKLKLIEYMKSHKGKKLHQQKITCGSRLKKYYTLFRCYRCCLCNYVTKYKWSLGFHIRTHLTKKNYKQILNRRRIKKNQSTITFNKINKDDKGKCNSHSYNKQVLKSRSNLLHKYLKSKCHFSQHSLKPNGEVHMAYKPFKCSVCEYNCNYRSVLKQHMLIHIDDKPFTCSVCEYKRRLKSSLKTHVLIHTGDKPLTCTVADTE